MRPCGEASSRPGLAEIASTLEAEVGRPGLFSYAQGTGEPGRIADGLDRLIAQPFEERTYLREDIVAFSHREWTWDRPAERLLDAARAAG